MKVSVFASALCLFSGLVSSLAVPVAEPEAGKIEARGVAATIYPSLLVPIFEDYPNVAFGSYYFAEVERSNGAHNVQTLIAYNFTTGYSGQTCTFSFSNARGASGSQKVQLFTVQGAITTSTSFSYRPPRGDFVGTFNAVVNGVGSFDGGAPTFPCPTSPTTLGYEAVPENDDDYVSWWINTGGLVIQVLN